MQNTQTSGPVRIGVIVGSTRPGRRSTAVAGWVTQVASRHSAVRDGNTAVEQSLTTMLTEIVTWTTALRAARAAADRPELVG